MLESMTRVPSQELEICPEVLTQRIGEETVLLHLVSNRFYELNTTASDIWSGLVDGLTREALVERLSANYDASREAIEPQIDSLIEELRREQLIRARPDSAV